MKNLLYFASALCLLGAFPLHNSIAQTAVQASPDSEESVESGSDASEDDVMQEDGVVEEAPSETEDSGDQIPEETMSQDTVPEDAPAPQEDGVADDKGEEDVPSVGDDDQASKDETHQDEVGSDPFDGFPQDFSETEEEPIYFDADVLDEREEDPDAPVFGSDEDIFGADEEGATEEEDVHEGVDKDAADSQTTQSEKPDRLSMEELRKRVRHVSAADRQKKKEDNKPKKRTSRKKSEAQVLQEVKAEVMGAPTASSALSGRVNENPSVGIYDMYSRQLAFRENAKDLRQSIENRRDNFEKPRVVYLDEYRERMKKVYDAESAVYQKDLKSETSSAKKKKKTDRKTRAKAKRLKMKKEAEAVAARRRSKNSSESPSSQEKGHMHHANDTDGLQEHDIPQGSVGDKKPKRKVITSHDAPDFDPGNL